MVETRFDELKRYVRFHTEDAARLLALRPLAAPHFERIAREFYERIREHEEAHAVFTGEEQTERLQRSMVKWMGRLLSGVYDDAYYQETRQIGRVHVRVGLPERYMFTAMALIRVSLEAVAQAALGTEAAATRTSLNCLIDLDHGQELSREARRAGAPARRARVPDAAHRSRSRTAGLRGCD